MYLLVIINYKKTHLHIFISYILLFLYLTVTFVLYFNKRNKDILFIYLFIPFFWQYANNTWHHQGCGGILS